MKLKLGDRVVKYKSAYFGNNEIPVGSTGTIQHVGSRYYLVQYDSVYSISHGEDDWLKQIDKSNPIITSLLKYGTDTGTKAGFRKKESGNTTIE